MLIYFILLIDIFDKFILKLVEIAQNYPKEYTNIITHLIEELLQYREFYADLTVSTVNNVNLIINSINII